MINSREYWDERFRNEDWVKNKGDCQNRFFYKLLTDNLPTWFKKEILIKNYNIEDIGCAEGDGTYLLYEEFFNSEVIGIDISEEAIKKAKIKYPSMKFTCEINHTLNSDKKAEVVVSSNTAEHIRKPYLFFEDLTKRSSKYVVLLLPFQERERIQEHFATFEYESFPLEINQFNLIYHKEIDCSKMNETYWFGNQIILIYALKGEFSLAHSNNNLFEDCCKLSESIINLKSEIKWRQSEQERLLEIVEKTNLELTSLSKHTIEEIQILNEDICIKDNNISLLNEKNAIYSEQIKNISDEIAQQEKIINQKEMLIQVQQDEISKYEEELLNLNQLMYNQTNTLNELIEEIEILKKELVVFEQGNKLIEASSKEKYIKYNEKLMTATTQLDTLFDIPKIQKLFKVYAVGKKIKHSSISTKLEILKKSIQRLFGKQNDLGTHSYNPINEIHYIIQEMRLTIFNLNKELENSKISSNHTPIQEIHLINEMTVTSEYCIEKPLVSVLLPIYNHSQFIDSAIKSVQGQTYRNWELIILDDGSTDDLYLKLSKYKNDYRIKVYQQQNQRLPKALTNLHNLAKGKFVTWTSADNIMANNMIEELVRAMYKWPKNSFVYGDVAIIDDHGELLYGGDYRPHNRDKERSYILRLPNDTSYLNSELDNYINACFMYRREFLEVLKGQYGHDLTGLEDYDFWLRLNKIAQGKHIGNKEPLYYYRVHENTMSEDLIKNKLDYHLRRGKMLIDFDNEREKMVNHKPCIITTGNIGIDIESLLEKNRLSSDINSNKKIYITNEDTQYSNGVTVRVIDGEYRVYDPKSREVLYNTNIGVKYNDLLRKARYHHPPTPYYEFPKVFGEKKNIGVYCNFSQINTDKLKQIIEQNKEYNYILIDKEDNGSLIKEILENNQEHVIYLSKHTDEMYAIHGYIDYVLIPEFNNCQKQNTCEILVYAWEIGKVALIPKGMQREGYPYTISYEISLPKMADIENIDMELIDKYIELQKPENKLEQTLRVASVIWMENYLERPDFGEDAGIIIPPERYIFERIQPAFECKQGWVGIWTETLDKGGLEQMVAFLSRRFAKRGIHVKILCSISGGSIANELMSEGFEVVVFEDDEKKFKAFLEKNPPRIITAHYVNKFLNVPNELGIKVVESIHNMYGFYNELDWKRENKKSQLFDHFICCSEIVKEYYLKWNTGITSKQISIVNNTADVDRISHLDGKFMRQQFGINENDIVFISIASLDARKNQLGLITAFNEVADQNKHVKLILIGNALDGNYYQLVQEHLQQTQHRDQIIMLDYCKDAGAMFNMADVFVMPSYIEGWSVAATEAAYSGLPIIHTNCGSGPELCGDGKYGIVINNPIRDYCSITQDNLYKEVFNKVPNNTDELIEAMNKIIDEISRWREKRGAIASRAITEFASESVIDQYIDVLNKLNK